MSFSPASSPTSIRLTLSRLAPLLSRAEKPSEFSSRNYIVYTSGNLGWKKNNANEPSARQRLITNINSMTGSSFNASNNQDGQSRSQQRQSAFFKKVKSDSSWTPAGSMCSGISRLKPRHGRAMKGLKQFWERRKHGEEACRQVCGLQLSKVVQVW
jgi:hypothetical protein